MDTRHFVYEQLIGKGRKRSDRDLSKAIDRAMAQAVICRPLTGSVRLDLLWTKY
jgi:hypothetical protein